MTKFKSSGLVTSFIDFVFEKKIRIITLGMACTLASPPIYFAPVLFFIPLAIFVSKERDSFKNAVEVLVAFFGGYFAGNFWFIPSTLLINKSYWALIIPSLVMSSAIFVATMLITMLPALYIIRKKIVTPFVEYILIIAAWFVFEVFKSNKFFFGGLPWQTIGTIWTISDSTIQIAYYIGRKGLDLMALVFVMSPYLFLQKFRYFKYYAVFLFFTLVSIVCFGIYRPTQKTTILNNTDIENNGRKIIRMIGIQGNVMQKMIYDSREDINKRSMVFRHYAGLAKTLMEKYTHDEQVISIFPEGAILFYDLNYSSEMCKALAEKIIGNKGLFIFASIVFEEDRLLKKEIPFNAITVINKDAEIVGIYKKRNLVPFGEYIPSARILPESIRYLFGIGGLEPGKGPIEHIVVNGIRIIPMLCYDVIFDDDWKDKDGNKPDIAINLSNDAWLDNSLGSFQHFALVRLRAVITKTPIFRIANNGISSYIDEYGRVVYQLPAKQIGFLQWNLPVEHTVNDMIKNHQKNDIGKQSFPQ